jgi:hypothetical protein
VRYLIEHPDLGEREAALEEALVQQTHASGVKAIEPPDPGGRGEPGGHKHLRGGMLQGSGNACFCQAFFVEGLPAVGAELAGLSFGTNVLLDARLTSPDSL